MKKVKKLSIILACMFSMSLVTVNGMVDKVSAAEAKTLKVNTLYTDFAIQYKDKSFFCGTNDDICMIKSMPLSVMKNGETKVIRDNFAGKVLGHDGAAYYIQGYGQNYQEDIYVLDAEKDSLKLLKKNHVAEARKVLKSKYPDVDDRVNDKVQYNKSGKLWYLFHGRNKSNGMDYYYIANSDGYADFRENCEYENSFTGNDGSLYVLQSTVVSQGKLEYKVVHISNDKTVTEYSIDEKLTTGSNHSWTMDPQGNLYFVQVISNLEDMKHPKFLHRLIKADINENAKKISMANKVIETNDSLGLEKDFCGKMWMERADFNNNLCEIFKMENGSFVSKYSVNRASMSFSVYDDNNLIAYGDEGYATTSQQKGGSTTNPKTPEAKPADPNGNTGTNDKGSKAGESLPETGSAVDTNVQVGLGLLSAAAGAAILLKKKN